MWSFCLCKYTHYRQSLFPKCAVGVAATVNVKHYDRLVKSWMDKVANVWGFCVGWKFETETIVDCHRANSIHHFWGQTHNQRKHTPASSFWVKPLDDLCVFEPCLWKTKQNKNKPNQIKPEKYFHEKNQDIQVVTSSVFVSESLNIAEFQQHTTELIINMFLHLANNIQFWNEQFLKDYFSGSALQKWSTSRAHNFPVSPGVLIKAFSSCEQVFSIWKLQPSF